MKEKLNTKKLLSVLLAAVMAATVLLTGMQLFAQSRVNAAYSTPMISSGGGHALALKSDGTVWAWGRGSFGQLGSGGSGSSADTSTPVQVRDGSGYLSGVAAISAGENHSLALKSDGTVWAWGRNEYGQLGDGSMTNRLTPVQVLDYDGINYLTGVRAIAVGCFYSLALKSDGTVWAWGENACGSLGDGSSGVGTEKSTPVQVLGAGGSGYLTDVVAISAGIQHAMALKSDGTVWTWGAGFYGQLGNNTNGYSADKSTPVQVLGGASGSVYLSGVAVISAGSTDSMALKSDGTVWAWGRNNSGSLGNGNSSRQSTPVQVVGLDGNGHLTGIIAISAGNEHPLALEGDGTVWAWGSNQYGQLGNSSDVNIVRNSTTPVKVDLPGNTVTVTTTVTTSVPTTVLTTTTSVITTTVPTTMTSVVPTTVTTSVPTTVTAITTTVVRTTIPTTITLDVPTTIITSVPTTITRTVSSAVTTTVPVTVTTSVSATTTAVVTTAVPTTVTSTATVPTTIVTSYPTTTTAVVTTMIPTTVTSAVPTTIPVKENSCINWWLLILAVIFGLGLLVMIVMRTRKKQEETGRTQGTL